MKFSRGWTALLFALSTFLAGGIYFASRPKTAGQPIEIDPVAASAPARSRQSQPAAPGSNSSDNPAVPGASSQAPVATDRPLPAVFGLSGEVRLNDVPSGRFRDELGRLSEEARKYALQKLEHLRVPLNDIGSLHADANGHLYYGCPAVTAAQDLEVNSMPSAADESGSVEEVGFSPVPIASPPVRHSKPGATKVIYLDFNGHTITGTQWNLAEGAPNDPDYRPAVATYVAKPFNSDGDDTSFSDSEQAAIIRIWERVAEDFIPFDVDVTTEQPVSFTATTGRILITPSIDANGLEMPSSRNHGGVAYLDVFGGSKYVGTYSPAFVYSDKEYNYADYIAEAASHEMGHNLSLSHDGTLPNSTANEYYSGHGYDSSSWAPIMGSSYTRNVTQWSKGEYYNANNTQDDLALISGHLGYAFSAPVDSNAAATALPGSLIGSGIIGTTSEADRFSFTVVTSLVDFTVSPFATLADKAGGNADLQLELYDSANTLIASGNSGNAYSPTATLSAGVAAGTYYLRVAGSGSGTPLATNPTGYTAYGSLGQYSISGSSSAASLPVISYPPYAQTAYAGQQVGFFVSAYGTPTPSYQWQRLPSGGSVWANLSDAGVYSGTKTYALNISIPTTAMNGDQFRCVATNIAGSVNSTAVALTVNPAVLPVISGLQATQTTNYGEYLSIYPGVSGTPPITYQWKKDGVDIPGAVYYSYSKSGATTTDSGSYILTATNYAGTATSSPVIVTVNPPVAPTISGLPASVAIEYGGQINFYPSVTGTQPITYQWKKDGVAIPNANSSYYYVYGLKSADSGQYTLTATNQVGATTSPVIAVTVAAVVTPTITQQPVSVDVSKGSSANFNVSVTGSPTMLFQWYKDGQIIPSGTYSYFSLSAVTSADSGNYSVRITNDGGSVTSATAVLTVLPAVVPTITGWTSQATISASYPYLSLGASVSGTAPFTYQWYKNGVVIPGATSSSYYDNSATEASAGTYAMRVTNEAGLAMSPDAIVRWTSAAPNTPWLDAVQQGNIVYFLAVSPGRIMRYDLSQEIWLPIVYLPETKVPSAFLPTAEGVFICYNRDLVRRSLDLQTEVSAGTSAATVQSLFSVGDFIYFQDGQTTRSVNRSTLVAGPDSLVGYYEAASFSRAARPVYSASAHTLYSSRVATTPNDILKFSVAQGGVITSDGDSPYHGDFRIGTRQYVTPDEAFLFDNSGVIYALASVNYAASLGSPFDDLTFLANGAPVALRGNTLTNHGESGYAETGRYTLGAPGYALFSKSNIAFAFGAPASNASNPIVTKVAASAFSPAVAATPGSPTNKLFSVDDAFIDSSVVIHLLSRSEQGIVRWDTKTGQFLTTLPLRGKPLFSTYAPAIDRLAMVYGDGALSDFFPGTNSSEQVFGYIPTQNWPFSLIALDDLTFLNIHQADVSADLRIVLGPLGELKSLSTWNYWGMAQAWQSASRRLYSISQYGYSNGIECVEIPPTGIPQNSAAATATNVIPPLRFSADGALVLSSNMRILNADLQQVGTLENAVIDGVWLPDGLYTIRVRPTGTEVQKWARTVYSKTGSLALRGVPIRIFKLTNNSLIVVTLVEGYTAFNFVSSDLSLTDSVINAVLPPGILSHPTSRTVTSGYPVAFSVIATGAPSFTYQWRKDGVNISGATGQSFNLASVTNGDAGAYSVVVTSSSGSTTSNAATLTVTPAVPTSTRPTDFNGDNKSDILWQNTSTGQRSIWLMNGTTLTAGVSLGLSPTQWSIAAVADFNADGKPDLLWQNTLTGERTFWLMNGSAFASSVGLGTYSPDLMIAGAGDFNGDGQPDLVWQNTSTGERSIWLMNGTTLASVIDLGTFPPEWSIAGTGEFNEDGKCDLIWQNTVTGERALWLMDGTTVTAGVALGVYPQLQISGTGDYNGDGKSDILWTNVSTGERIIWLMNGTTKSSQVSLGVVSLDWVLTRPVFRRALADFNNDGKSDLLWQNTTTGDRAIWVMNGIEARTGLSLGNYAVDQWIAAIGDFNNDGKADLVWENRTTGARSIALMNSTTVLSSVVLGTYDPTWKINTTGDFNADGKPDLVWTNTLTGARAIWLMDGTAFTAGVDLGTVMGAQQIAGTGDFDADGKTDILWQNTTTGARTIWLMNGTTHTSTVTLGTYAPEWSIVGTGDYNADGKPDLLWQNINTGERAIWLMDGTSFLSSSAIGTYDTHWSIRN